MSRSWAVLKKFITDIVDAGGYINGAANLGGGAELLINIVAGVLNSRTIVADAGISVNQVGDTIVIGNTAVSGVKTAIIPFDTNTNYNAYRTRSIGTGGAFRVSGVLPSNINTITRVSLICAPTGGAAGAGKDIDIFTEFGAVGEGVLNHTQDDTTSVYDFSGLADVWTEIDLTALLTGGTPSLSAGDNLGIAIDHNGIGGAIQYHSLRIEYT